MENNAILNYEQQFYLSGILLSGVTQINGGYSVSESPINIIGKGYCRPVRQGPLIGDFSISKYYIGQDPLLNYTGDSPISGSINYNGKSFGFKDGYLNEYSISAGIGQIPTSQASIAVFGDIGSGIDASGNRSHPVIQIPNQGSISINSNGYQTNRITSFDYNLRIERSPVYKIGSPFAVQVDRKFPIQQELSLSMEVSDFESRQLYEYIISPMQHDLVLGLKNPITRNDIQNFTIYNARLLSQSITSSSEDVMTVNLTYNGYINKK